MANIINYLKHIQPVYRRSSNKMKIFVIGILIFGMTGLFALHYATEALEAKSTALEREAAQLEQENTAYQENIGVNGSVQGVEQIARDELGLVDPDTVLIQPGN